MRLPWGLPFSGGSTPRPSRTMSPDSKATAAARADLDGLGAAAVCLLTPGEDRMAIAAEMAALTREQMLHMFRSMAEIRAFETRAYELYREGVMRGTTHAYV